MPSPTPTATLDHLLRLKALFGWASNRSDFLAAANGPLLAPGGLAWSHKTLNASLEQFVVRDSIEEKILDLHRAKRDLASELLEGSEMSARLTDEDLLDLIRG